MAKYESVGLSWVNDNLKGFLKDIEKQGKAVLESNAGLKEYTYTVDEFNQKTKEWAKTTGVMTRTTEGFSMSVRQSAGVVDEAGDVITKTSGSFKAADNAAKQAGGPTGGMAILAKGATLLATSIQLYLISALKDLLQWVVKSIVYLATAPLRAVRDLAKLGFDFLVAAGKGAIEVLSSIGQAALTMTEKVVRGLANMALEALNVGAAFETAYAGVLKAGSNLTDMQGNITSLGKDVRQSFLDLIAVTPVKPEDIFRMGELGAQLNVTDTALPEFARVISAMIASTTLSAEEAALGFGKLSTVMGLGEEDFERMGSTVVWLGNNMGIVENDLIGFTDRASGVANMAGMATADLLGLGAAILRLGATPYAAASAFTQFVTNMVPAMIKGTEQGEVLAATAGMTLDEFKEAWKEDPAAAFLEFIRGLGLAGDEAILILDELGLANIRVTQAFASAAKSPELFAESLYGARRAWTQNIALAREAAIRYATVESQLQMLKNRMGIVKDTFFVAFQPAILAAISAGQRLLDVFTPIIKNVFERLVPLVERASGWFIRFGNAFDYMTWIGKDGLSTWEGFTRLMLDLFGLDTSMAGPLLKTIQDVVETVTGMFGQINFTSFTDMILGWANGIIRWFIDNWGPEIKPRILAAWNWITTYDWAGLWETITDNGQLVIDWFTEHWPGIRDTVVGTWNDIMDFLFGPKATFRGQEIPGAERIGGFANGLIEGFENIRIAVKDAMDTLVPAIQNTIRAIAVALGGDEGMTAKEAGLFATEKIAQMVGAYTKLYEIILKVVESAANLRSGKSIGWQPGALEEEMTLSKALAMPFKTENYWDKMWAGIKNTFSQALTVDIPGYFSTWRQNAIAEAQAFESELVGHSIIPDMMNAMVGIFTTKLAEISTLWESTFGLSGQFSMGGLLGIISRSFTLYYDAGRSIVSAISDGMLASGYMMVEALKNNILKMQVAVGEEGDKTILKVLFDIGEKIVIRIKNAIIASYQIILDALELAMSLGGGLINQARAAAQSVTDGAATTTGTATTGGYIPPSPTVPQRYQRNYGTSGESSTQIGPNYVRSEMDLNYLGNVVDQRVADSLAPP